METTYSEQRDRISVDVILFLARVTAAVVFFPHGAQHLMGSFGGPGLARFVAGLGPVGYLVAIGEFFGPMALIAGIGSRFSAASIAIIMVGAVATRHYRYGFFMNWGGRQQGEGFEYHLLAIALLLATVIAGPGRYSLARHWRMPKILK